MCFSCYDVYSVVFYAHTLKKSKTVQLLEATRLMFTRSFFYIGLSVTKHRSWRAYFA